jgi:AraC family transcriptional regulator
VSIECASPLPFTPRRLDPPSASPWARARGFSPTNRECGGSSEFGDIDPAKLETAPKAHGSEWRLWHPTVDVFPPDAVRRRAMTARGITAEIIQSAIDVKLDYRFRAPVHLLVAYEEGLRRGGETFVEGLPCVATLRRFAGKLTFVPAGCRYHEWHELRAPSRLTYLYFEPGKLGHSSRDAAFGPRVFFEDESLWHSAREVADYVEHPEPGDHNYFEALGTIIMHRLLRLHRGDFCVQRRLRGGLAAWQQRIVTNYIEEHLAERIELVTLAGLVRQSPFHFCRAFKQSLGLPPLRYQAQRRIDRAKLLLGEAAMSITDIGLAMGFGSSSSFTTAFRKATGFTPTAYQRSLG